MEESLTQAEQVRRKLKAGAPRKIVNELISPLEAIYRAAERVERARTWMSDAGLNPDDIRAYLVWSIPEDPENAEPGTYKPELIPTSCAVGAILADLEQRAARNTMLFLGLLWWQADRNSKTTSPITLWVSQWMGGKAAETVLRVVRDAIAKRTMEGFGKGLS
jgi:hypothetical protein